MVRPRCCRGRKCGAAQRQIIALRPAAGENDLSRAGAEDRRHALARFLQGCFG